MKQLVFGSDAASLKIEAPTEWAVQDLTGVDFAAYNDNGEELLSSDAATLYPSTTLDENVLQFADSFVLADGATAPIKGDPLVLLGPSGREFVIVDGYNASTKTVKCEQIINRNFDAGDAVYGTSISYEIDISDTDVFKPGMVFTIRWTPSGTGIAIEERVQVSKFAVDVEGIERDFRDIYPRAYNAFKEPVDRFASMVQAAEKRLTIDMRTENMDYNRVIGEDIIPIALMAKMACLWVLQGDIDLDDERKEINKDYSSIFGELKALPIWTDTNQDNKVDDVEISTHNHIFQRSW